MPLPLSPCPQAPAVMKVQAPATPFPFNPLPANTPTKKNIPQFPPPPCGTSCPYDGTGPCPHCCFHNSAHYEGTGPRPHEGTGPGPHEVQALPQQKQNTAKIDITNQCCSMSERGEEMEPHPCSHYSAFGPSRYEHPKQQVPCTGGFPPSVWDLKLK